MIKAPLRSRSSIQPNLSASALFLQIDLNRFSAFAHTGMPSTEHCKFGTVCFFPLFRLFSDPHTVFYSIHISRSQYMETLGAVFGKPGML